MGFSGALKIADLNDFIAPSQACVVTLDSVKDEIAKADFLQVVHLSLHHHNLHKLPKQI